MNAQQQSELKDVFSASNLAREMIEKNHFAAVCSSFQLPKRHYFFY